MKKYFSIAILFIIFFLLGSISISAKVDIGGELNMTLSGAFFQESEALAYPQGSLDLELYIPPFYSNQIKSAVYLYTDPATGQLDFMFKKLYLKHKFDKLQLTVGRQPISWSFGSMLNPVDFTLGSVVMDEEAGSKYLNAIEAYYPINWNSSITAIAAFPNGFKNMKWGLRGRTTLEGYDLTLNYVREPEIDFMGTIFPASQRIGFTAKGDLGPLGVYGALGYYFKDNDDGDLAYLIGGDYSYFFEAGNKIYFQLEYLSIKKDNLSSVLGPFFAGNVTSNLKENIGLILGMANYEIDEFSQINLMVISSLNDGSIIVMPGYSSQLNNNLSFNLSTAIYFGKEDTIFGPNVSEGVQQRPKGMISIGFTYSF